MSIGFLLTLKETQGAITSASKLFEKIGKINIDYSQENFILFYLDTKNKVIDSEVLFKGGLNSCVIDPKTIFRKALTYNANAVIMAHNHPSGDLNPSYEDIRAFENLRQAGEILLLKFLDSIIFNETQFYTMEAV